MTPDRDEAELIEARQLRDMARAIVRDNLTTLQVGLAARPIRQRLRDRAVNLAADGVEQAVDLARNSKTVIALTLAALAAWFARRSLLALLRRGYRYLAAQMAARHHDTGTD